MTKSTGMLTGKTALVTGASGGIGSEIARCLADHGADVVLQYNLNNPQQLVEIIGDIGGKCHAIQANLNSHGFEIELLDAAERHLARPDILVNCAASQLVAELSNMSQSDFADMMHTNVNSVFALSREFASRLPDKTTTASIVNISSTQAIRPAPGHGHYATSKAALEMLTKAMALEYGPKGLRVNAIAPGLISRPGLEDDWPTGVESWQKACPLARMGTPEDIAAAVAFLVSHSAGFITGTVLTVDGGMATTPGW